MTKHWRIIGILTIILITNSCQLHKPILSPRPGMWAQKINLPGLVNFYKVDNELFRSEQPDHEQLIKLDSLGVKTILNLRHTHNDKHYAHGTNLVLHQISINTWTISYDDIVSALKCIKSAKKPVLIHCLHGSDRTGCIVAAYRITVNGWTKEEAIREFKEGGYGYHSSWFPNILRLLNSLDIIKLKHDVVDNS